MARLDLFMDSIGGKFWEDFRISKVYLSNLNRFINLSAKEKIEVGYLCNLVNKNTLLKYQSLKTLFKQLFLDSENVILPEKVKRAFLILFLFETNKLIQEGYHLFLDSHGHSTPFRDEGIADILKEAEPFTYKIIIAADLEKIVKWTGLEWNKESADYILMQLSNLMFPVYQVNFRISFLCNAQCRHCYNSSGPYYKGPKLNTHKIIGVIRQMPEVGIRALNITGGEPFLFKKEILFLIRESRKKKISRISIFTNGFWGHSKEKAREVLESLRKAGFMNEIGKRSDFIKISAGTFHQEFIPYESISNIINCYFEMFRKRIIIDYEIFADSDRIRKDFLKKLSLSKLDDKVEVHYRYVYAVGRGERLFRDLKTYEEEKTFSCYSINQVVFDPDGIAKPCCGLNSDNKGIAIGDMYNNSLKEMIKNMQNSPVLQYVLKKDIGSLIKQLEKSPKKGKFYGICSLCEEALGDINFFNALTKELAFEREFYPFWLTAEKYYSYI